MLKVLMTVFFSLLIHLANSQEALKKTTTGTIFFSNQPFGNSSAGSKKVSVQESLFMPDWSYRTKP